MRLFYILYLLLLSLVFFSCEKGEDIVVEQNTVFIKQAEDVFNSLNGKCNYEINIGEGETGIVELTLNAATKEVVNATEGCEVELYINEEVFNTLKHYPYYQEIKSAEILPSEAFELSSNKLYIKTGESQSESVTLKINSEKVWGLTSDEELHPFVLPLSVKTTGEYPVDEKLHTLLCIVNPRFKLMLPDNSEPVETLENGQTLVWNDEFNGTELDESKWTWETGFSRNEQLEWNQRENVYFENGSVVLEGRVERVPNPNYDPSSSDWKLNRQYAEYTSASILTRDRFEFKYGTLIVRAKIPITRGAWPAIWTLGNMWEWPMNGEVDLLEMYLRAHEDFGDELVPTIWANACWGSNTRWSAVWDSATKPVAFFIQDDPLWVDKYHIWKMEWTPDAIKLYLDDELRNTIETSKTKNGSGNGSNPLEGAYQNPFSNDVEGFRQYILLNLALGGGGGTPDNSYFPLKYYIDYVRVYQGTPDNSLQQ